tara:strand:+ start:1165 stop:1473 length:309 start_codon:yes stop_codon:yes gene_type:complete
MFGQNLDKIDARAIQKAMEMFGAPTELLKNTRTRNKRGSRRDSKMRRTVASLHSEIETKGVQAFVRQKRGRYHCMYFDPPAKEMPLNFLEKHLESRGEQEPS